MNAAIPVATPWIANLAIAVMILLLGFMAGKLLGAIINRLLIEIQLDKALTGVTDTKFSPSNFITSTISAAIYIISFFFALDRLGITTIFLQIILVCIIIVILGSIVIGLTTTLPNLYAGIIIKTGEKFRNGQVITLKTVKAKVDKIYLFRTKLVTNQGDTLYIGNSTLWRKGKLA